MVMIQVKEPVKSSRFFIGELLASECFVEVDGIKGVAVIMGDDMKKALAAAVLDAAHTAKFDEFKSVETKLFDLEKQRIVKRKKEAAIFRQTQVDFKILEDDYAD
jgi:alpha-D-ribose 1-methylphosphonate 5-triphosphate synthase subunit PhnG